VPRFLFWNYRYDGPDREEILAGLVRDLAIDVVILAEASVDDPSLLVRFNAGDRTFRAMPTPHKYIKIYAGYPDGFFSGWNRDEGRLCLRGLNFPDHPEIILGALHLKSGRYAERAERREHAVPAASAVREAQRFFKHARVIITGDFNLNPYDEGMISPSGFGAMTSKTLVKKYVFHQGDRFSRLYNPSWRILGRPPSKGPPGTYYWDAHRPFNTYWNCLDQVLVGHDLLDRFPDDGFRILTAIPGRSGGRSLIRETRQHWYLDEISDHLPLVFDLDFSSEVIHD